MEGGIISFDDLPPVTREDICSVIFERVEWWARANAAWRWDTEEVHSVLSDQVDPVYLRVCEIPITSITGFNRNNSDVAVQHYVKMLSASEAPPILVDGLEFIDGGHRLGAYIVANRLTVPAADIGHLLRLDWSLYVGENSP